MRHAASRYKLGSKRPETMRLVRGKHGMMYVYVGGLKRGFITEVKKKGWRYSGKLYAHQALALDAILADIGFGPNFRASQGTIQQMM